MAHLTPPVGPQDKTQGPATAPVTLVEYGDYECPACGMAYGILKLVQNEMADDLCFVFRNFPLTDIHPHAEHAAEIAEEAAVAGSFWPMHDMLFENQGALDDPSLVAYGEQLGLGERGLLDALGGSHVQRIRRISSAAFGAVSTGRRRCSSMDSVMTALWIRRACWRSGASRPCQIARIMSVPADRAPQSFVVEGGRRGRSRLAGSSNASSPGPSPDPAVS